MTKSWTSGSQGNSPNKVLFDENVKCWSSDYCFETCKPGDTIERNDICERCGMKWKWHYDGPGKLTY